MSRSPLGRKLPVRLRAAQRLFLVAALVALVAAIPYVKAGAWQQEEEAAAVRPRAVSQPAAKGQANIVEGAEFVPGDVLVRFRTETAAKTAEAVALPLRAAGDGGEVSIERFDGSEMVRGLRLAKVDPARTLEAVAELAARSDVLYAEPNYIWRATRTPNDPRYVSGEMYGMNRIGAPAAWNTTVGSRSIVVGVIDGGIDVNHPDLKANIWTNPGDPVNNVDDDGNGLIDDVNGWDFVHNDRTVYDSPAEDDHGTHVAGTIGAHGDNNTGVTGVNWEVSLVSIKVLGPEGGSTSNIIKGYNYARNLRLAGVNLRVLNNSYGGPGKSLSAFDAINQLSSAGILFVVAAGNSGRDNFSHPDYPSNYDAPNVIAVASTTSTDSLSGFSNFGARLVSMGAPGSSILSTTPNNTYSFFSGTSMSAPHVAGAAALICSVNATCANSSAKDSGITTAQLRGLLAFTGDRISALETRTTTGRRLNVANAIAALEPGNVADSTAPAAAGSFRVTGQSGRSVTLAWTAPGDDGNSGTAADYDFYFLSPTTGIKTLLPTTLAPAAAGTQQTITVDVPYINFIGTIQLRTYDDAGNNSLASVGLSIPVNVGSDPYTVALTASSGLTPMTGTSLVTGDDKYAVRDLPFAFPFYGVSRTSLTVSTNGVLYFSTPPRRPNGDADDVPSAVEGMQGQTMIAGLWDDIDINPTVRPDSGIFVTQPDASRIIFRWQGVTFQPPRVSINFEIELRSDGTIQMRYGDNQRVYPVVGISGGEPDAYVVASHTREQISTTTQPISLTNAQTITFAPRLAPLFTISGRVTDANGAGAPATIFLSGGGNAVTMPDAAGNYSFTGLTANLAYTVTPSHPNYTYTPTSFNIANLTSDQGANFTATLRSQAGPNSVGIVQTSYQLAEQDGRATFMIARSGDTIGAATVDYRTTDADNFTVGCADSTNNNGAAFARCDFATVVGTLSFAPGELNKTIVVPIIDDAHQEGAETFQLQLTNATGTGTMLGAGSVSTITILDNDAGGAPNPVTNSIPFFVRQQYLDFLSREPDQGGFDAWSGVLTNCANIFAAPEVNTDCDRIAVSRAFFGSTEFQLKGSYVFRFYKLAFNRLPLYTEIVSDMSFVAGATEAEVYARRAQLATAFIARPEFQNAYNGMSNAQFVTALLGRYGLTQVTTPDPATPDSGTRVTFTSATLISQLDDNSLTRAQVFRAIADSDQVQAAEYNSAFVAIQYYGYLRRTPDAGGYQDNLNALGRGVSPREMVNAFLNSTEYKLRFGQP